MEKEKVVRLDIRLSEDEAQRLDELCEALQTSRIGLIRRVINSPIIIDQVNKNSVYDEYMDAIRILSHSFKDLVYTPMENKIVYRADIVMMSDMIKEIKEKNQLFVEEFLKEQKSITARTRRQVDAGLKKLKEKG